MPKRFEIGQVVGGVTIVGKVADEKYNKYLLRCNSCGVEFVEYATSVREHEYGCSQCKYKKRSQENREKYVARSEEVYGNLKILGIDEDATNKDKNKRTYVKCQCLKCNDITSIPLLRIKTGQAKECAACARKNLDLGKEYVKNDSVCHTRISCISGKSVNKNNTSGYKGVCKGRRGKYRAYINFQRHQYYLGEYDTPEEAHAVRMEAEDKIYGNFLNWYAETFPDKWKLLNRNKNREDI